MGLGDINYSVNTAELGTPSTGDQTMDGGFAYKPVNYDLLGNWHHKKFGGVNLGTDNSPIGNLNDFGTSNAGGTWDFLKNKDAIAGITGLGGLALGALDYATRKPYYDAQVKALKQNTQIAKANYQNMLGVRSGFSKGLAAGLAGKTV